jgi:alkylation response protein AidB-like acyl-CoA dehydrogenase
LLALNGTASGAVQLDDVEVPAEAVLSVDLRGFVGRIRPAFLLIQTAFCAGLALRSVGEAGEYLTGPNAELAGAVRATEARAVSVHQRLHAAAADPGRVGVAELLRLRLDAATTAADATRMEATVRGGAGYLASSEVSRRLREAAFLPIQSPTEGQLRWELSRYA